MDALSEVLKAIRLTGAVFVNAELGAGCSLVTPPPRLIGALHMPGAEHIIPYHLVSEGRCFARLPDGTPTELVAGDLVVFPHGDSHVLCSSDRTDLPPLELSAEQLAQMIRPGAIAPLCVGEGPRTRLV